MGRSSHCSPLQPCQRLEKGCSRNNAKGPQLASPSTWCPLRHSRPDPGRLKPVSQPLTSQASKQMKATLVWCTSMQHNVAISLPTVITSCLYKLWVPSNLQRDLITPFPAISSQEIASSQSANTACNRPTAGKQQQIVKFSRFPPGGQPKPCQVPANYLKGTPTMCHSIAANSSRESDSSNGLLNFDSSNFSLDPKMAAYLMQTLCLTYIT